VPAERAILTPSQLNALARDLLEGSFPLIWVEGELSGVSRPASGHLYFTLKDARAQVRCAFFKPKSQWLKFRPADGVQVLLRARLTVYEARGDYQLVVDSMEEAGQGALQRAFEELKARLAAEGLFEAARKRPLPRYVRRLGLLTSPSGAAVRDVLSILRRRFPLIAAEVLPIPVQGAGAAAQAAQMLGRADASGRYDVLLLTRGGGSLEDLAAFNDETLARAIAALRTPLVSAVGHEIDFSIADFVADLRAPTPSAAAEILTPDRNELLAVLARRRTQLENCARRQRETRAQRLDQLQQRLHAQRPQARLQRGRERLRDLAARLQRQPRGLLSRLQERRAALALRLDRMHPRHRMATLCERGRLLAARLQRMHPRQRLRALREHGAQLGLRLSRQHPRQRLAALAARLAQAGSRQQLLTVRALENRALQLAALGRALNAVSPLATLGRGYALLLDPISGRVLRRIDDIAPGTELDARLVDGVVRLKRES
jgi:exodeoxyribonuclease VII large subunit